MIAITKEEKEAIRERFPDVNIVRTMKQRSKRHRYYCEETGPVMRLLAKLRNTEPRENHKRRDVRHADRPNGKRV